MKIMKILLALAVVAVFPVSAFAGDLLDGAYTPDVLRHTQIALVKTAQTIAGGDTVTADACGGVKLVTAGGSVTTNTTNTFTAPTAALAGCIMVVVNTGSNAITLDDNTNFNTTGNIALGQYDSATVACDGTYWYLVATSNN